MGVKEVPAQVLGERTMRGRDFLTQEHRTILRERRGGSTVSRDYTAGFCAVLEQWVLTQMGASRCCCDFNVWEVGVSGRARPIGLPCSSSS